MVTLAGLEPATSPAPGEQGRSIPLELQRRHDLHDRLWLADIERTIGVFARDANGGMVAESGPSIVHRDLIIALAARYRLPEVYPLRGFVISGGLISYGNNSVDPYRRAAAYVDRIRATCRCRCPPNWS